MHMHIHRHSKREACAKDGGRVVTLYPIILNNPIIIIQGLYGIVINMYILYTYSYICLKDIEYHQ